MKKQIRDILCITLCLATVCSTAACGQGGGNGGLPASDYLSASVEKNSGAQEESASDYEESEETSENGNNESSENGGGNSENGGEENEGDSGETDGDLGGSGGLEGDVNEPNPEKVLDREETDALGHKIAYYKDGTWENLGRVIPLDFTPKAMDERLGYQTLGLETKGTEKQAFYADLFNEALHFSNSNKDLASEEVSGETVYILAKVDGGKYSLTSEQMKAVWRTMRQDCPEFYWFSTQFWSTESELWMCINEEYARGVARASLKTKIEQAALECDGYLNGKMSATELAVTINDYLTANVTYAYEADGVTPSEAVWAHNITGWAEKDLGVCETYAESYAYLCGLFGLECWTVTGVAAQNGAMSGHAWNILKLDGEWHNVDVTWNDGFETSNAKLLSRDWFGMGATEFNNTHLADVPSADGMSYQIPLPNLSDTSLAPVLLQEENGEAVMVSSLDNAFEKMSNAGGRYVITLYPGSNAQVSANKVIYPQGYEFATTQLPAVAEITILGERYISNPETGAYAPATLQTNGVIALQGELCLSGFELYASAVQLGVNTLTVMKNTAVKTNVIGGVGSVVKVMSADGMATMQGIQADTIEIVSGDLYTLGELVAQTAYLHASTLLVHQSAANITFANLYTDYAGANIITTATTGTTVITLGNVGGIDGRSVKSLMLEVRFAGMANYPTISITGEVKGRLVLAITGTQSQEDKTPITSNDFNGAAVASVTSRVTQTEFEVGFTSNNTVKLVSYIYDSAMGAVRVW